jgi:heme/copper-type cytochrome/quinol oxidase subunit 2
MDNAMLYIVGLVVNLYWLAVIFLPSWDAKELNWKKRLSLVLACLVFGLLLGFFFTIIWFLTRIANKRYGVRTRITNRKARIAIGIVVILTMLPTYMFMVMFAQSIDLL